jgi:tyrosinase
MTTCLTATSVSATFTLERLWMTQMLIILCITLSNPLLEPTDIPEEFYEELNEFTTAHDVGQPYVDCFDVDQIRTECLLHWLMRTILVPKQGLLRLLQHGVVMIGDSAHVVPILGGQGANIAILDTIKLANALAE